VLGAIRYQENEAVLHTDASLLPRARRAWAAWNYHVLREPGERVALTYNMNILQGLAAPETYCVTLNRTAEIRPDRIVKRLVYHHPLFTPEAVAAQARQRELNAGRTFYCGAYWRFGFHEDGVVSALAALDHFEESVRAQRGLSRVA
jgi:predicted NAD/FAD-binding protein